MKNKRINGIQFEKMVRNGLANLLLHEDEVNKLNVFPVPDGDTGINMRLTLESGVKYAKPNEVLAHYLKPLSEGMLLGARGNSGVILSQFFKGMQLELARCVVAGPGELRNALIRGYRTAYASVIKPVEGTILTVTREGIEHIRGQISRATAIEDLLAMYIAEMKKTLAYTPELLLVLKEAGVIDSGGQGFIYIVEGMLGYLCGDLLREAQTPDTHKPAAKKQLDFSAFNENSKFSDGYCTEFILQLMKDGSYIQLFDVDRYIEDLKHYGNSLVVVRDGSRVKVHIHTLRPEKVIALSRQFGEFLTFKLENMQLQHNEVIKAQNEEKKLPHKELAMVAVVSGEGMKQLFEELGCDVVINCADTMNASSQEFIDAFNRIDADAIVVFPNNKNVILAAQQAQQLHGGRNIHILPSRSVAEGYFAMAMDVPDNELAYRISSMKSGLENVTTLAQTTASRDCSYNELSCRAGDEIVMKNGELFTVNKSWLEGVISALRLISDIDEMETCVIFCGEEATEDDREALTERLEEEFPLLEAELLEGGQRFYRWIIGLS